jgi:hypothetical protein
MPPAVLEKGAKILAREELKSKIHTKYAADKDYRQFVEYRSEGDYRQSPRSCQPLVETKLH